MTKNEWKTQLIHPNYKKGDRILCENYRPVSHIIEISKLVEYTVLEQVLKHFDENDLFHANHNGSLPNHSTATAIIQLYDIWIEAIENNMITAALLLDLSAAFDLVGHRILLKKMKLYNFSEGSLKFFREYFENRKIVVQIDSKRSTPKEGGEIGVPQGSVLGVLCFLINQNDFPASEAENDNSVLYMDDDTDNVIDSNPTNLMIKLQQQANKSTEWISDNGMVCSGGKTKLIIMASRDIRLSKIDFNTNFQVNVCNKVVSESADEKLLGVIISNDLTWRRHVNRYVDSRISLPFVSISAKYFRR